MIFKERTENEEKSFWYLDEYYPYRIGGELNPNFDTNSGLILDLKEGLLKGINHYFDILDEMLNRNITLCTVPSSDSLKKVTGIRSLAQKLAAHNRIDATSCLYRETTIPKAAHGGPRSVEVHLQTIRVINTHLIYNKEILLLDDIKTSGSSLKACKKLLLNAGAKKVVTLAVGKTTH
ncbi:hypothetical protein FZC78_22645 [Rossellomorea vietnamensis]|uniref:Phosphoribosyltransferase domain-containing protein n=1 Tax=Rossellomorea vietnamensis TaxID=218284 RepID=A0A5D4NI32_9BACI|nr:phosphoribosyltransferase family protein [Rossellomorea vietnamensis]TYS12986.1 hypothetical protein FZC78_22645 [Rossellomorea vietnamensis]